MKHPIFRVSHILGLCGEGVFSFSINPEGQTVTQICQVMPTWINSVALGVWLFSSHKHTCHFLFLLCNCFRWDPLIPWLASSLSFKNKERNTQRWDYWRATPTNNQCTVTMATWKQSASARVYRLNTCAWRKMYILSQSYLFNNLKWYMVKQKSQVHPTSIKNLLFFRSLEVRMRQRLTFWSRSQLRHQNAPPSWQQQAQ